MYFLGYPQNQDAYLCYDPIGRKMYISRDVRFLEEDFSINKYLCKDKGENFTQSTDERQMINYPIIRKEMILNKKVSGTIGNQPSSPNKRVSDTFPTESEYPNKINSTNYSTESGSTTDLTSPSSESQLGSTSSTEEEDSDRTTSDSAIDIESPITSPAEPNVTEMNVGNETHTNNRPVTRASRGIIKPNPRYALAVTGNGKFIPRSPRAAMQDQNWLSAMQAEVLALKKNETWELIDRSPEDNVINTKWIFKINQREDGSIEHYKARWVVNGMKQIEGTDYTHTLSVRW